MSKVQSLTGLYLNNLLFSYIEEVQHGVKVKSFRFHTAIGDDEINNFIEDKEIVDIKLSGRTYLKGSNSHTEHTVLILYK